MTLPEAVKDLANLTLMNHHRKIWKPFMEKYDCQFICELGVEEGVNFNQMILHKPRMAVAIDAWINDGVASHNDSTFTQELLNKQYENFKHQMEDKPFVKIIRDYTSNASRHFSDDTFDFVYIDADHSYEGCLGDITTWYPKVKKGKFLIGDDFREAFIPKSGVKFGVIEAVDEFAKRNKIKYYELPGYSWAIIK